MGRNRYRYNSRGKLVSFSSDESPLERGCTKILTWIGLPALLLLFWAAGSGEQDTNYQSIPNDEVGSLQERNGPTSVELERANSDTLVEESEEGAASIVKPVTQAAEVTEPILDPSVDPTAIVPRELLGAAIQEALETGNPVRWSANGEQGYVVPSAPQEETGCRTIYYSIDSQPSWQSPQETIC